MAYSQAVKVGNENYVARHPSFDFKSGLISSDFETQSRQAFTNLVMVLRAGGSSLDRVAKITIWLVDASNFECLNKLYAEYFPANPPVRLSPHSGLSKARVGGYIRAIATLEE